MEKYENDIHNVTAKRLADMVDEIANAGQENIELLSNDYPNREEIVKQIEKEGVVLREAARRLRERCKPACNSKRNECHG